MNTSDLMTYNVVISHMVCSHYCVASHEYFNGFIYRCVDNVTGIVNVCTLLGAIVHGINRNKELI